MKQPFVFELQLFAVSTPVGELATFGVGKETTYNVFAPPTVFHELEAFNPAGKTTLINRMGSVGASGMRPPATGAFDLSATLRVGSVSDICTQLIAYALGVQTTPVKAVIANTTVNATYTAASTSLTVASAAGIVVGQVVGVGGDANSPTVVSIAGNVVTLSAGGLANGHAVGTVVTFSSPTAYYSTYSFGFLRQLPSFSAEYQVPTVGGFGECLDYTGFIIENMKVALAPSKGLAIDYTLTGSNQIKQSSPTSASFSTKNIYTMESAGSSVSMNNAIIGGLLTPPDVRGWDLTLANQLDKSRRSAGSGRFMNGFPLGQRKVSGSLKLGFESEAARQIFWGNSSSPNATVAGIPLSLIVASQDLADAIGTTYAITFNMPNVRFTQADVPHKTSGGLEQTVNFQAFESATGANNDLTCTIVNTNATPW